MFLGAAMARYNTPTKLPKTWAKIINFCFHRLPTDEQAVAGSSI